MKAPTRPFAAFCGVFGWNLASFNPETVLFCPEILDNAAKAGSGLSRSS
jgi:hypothetical protein